MATKLIGIINSGGDCSGINAVISSLVHTGLNMQEYEFVGFYKGWEGLLNPMNYIKLDQGSIKGINHLGGTILHTVNKGRFAGKVGSNQSHIIPADILKEAKANAEKMGIEALLVIGGDGTLSAALQLQEIGINIVGVPKSIDNDLESTDMTFGFQTAIDIVNYAMRKIDSTATSHNRIMFVETMGRYTGWIALYGGLGSGAHMILIPEMPFEISAVIDFFKQRKNNDPNAAIMVMVAEGACEKGCNLVTQTKVAEEIKLGGISSYLIKRIEEEAPGEFEMRNVVLGHLQRGGSPTPMDKILAYRYGVAAMHTIHQKEYGHMVRLDHGVISSVPIKEAVQGLKKVNPSGELVQVAKSIGISFGC